MVKKMRVWAVAGLVSAVVAIAAVSLTETTSQTAERGTRVDNGGYTQLAWEVSTQRSGR